MRERKEEGEGEREIDAASATRRTEWISLIDIFLCGRVTVRGRSLLFIRDRPAGRPEKSGIGGD